MFHQLLGEHVKHETVIKQTQNQFIHNNRATNGDDMSVTMKNKFCKKYFERVCKSEWSPCGGESFYCSLQTRDATYKDLLCLVQTPVL